MKGVSIMFELCSGEHRNSLSSKLVVHGNIKFASEIRSIAIHLSRAGKSLYQAQDDIKAFVIRKCGGEWYKNGVMLCRPLSRMCIMMQLGSLALYRLIVKVV